MGFLASIGLSTLLLYIRAIVKDLTVDFGKLIIRQNDRAWPLSHFPACPAIASIMAGHPYRRH